MAEEIELTAEEKVTKALEEKAKADSDWLDKINEETDAKAKELESIFHCKVVPFVFVIEPQKDAAIGFLKQPDPIQSLKLYREIGANTENGIATIVKSQLIRTEDMVARKLDGTASDSRFMNIKGESDPMDSEINFSLLLKAKNLISIFRDQFKKK